MRKFLLVPLAASLFMGGTALATAQNYRGLRPGTDPSKWNRGDFALNCPRYMVHPSVRCWNFAGVASIGSNLFPYTGRPGIQPGSTVVFY